MKPASPALDALPPDVPPGAEIPATVSKPGSGFLHWLAFFTLYLGVVAVVIAIGFYFLWQIPVPQEVEQVFRNAGRAASAKPLPLTAQTTAPAGSVTPPAAPLQPLANPVPAPAADASPGEMATALPAPTPETDGDPTAPPQVVETPATDDQSMAAAEETPVEEPTPPPPTPQEEITQLLAEARQQMDSRRITAPADRNALRSYQRVLELDPGNAAAQAGIEQIAAHYRQVAEQSLRQGRPDESLAYISRGLRADPRHQEMLNLRQQARLIQQQRELAQQEELRRQQLEQELAERQYQERLRQQRLQEQQPWWQQPPTYDTSSGFNQR